MTWHLKILCVLFCMAGAALLPNPLAAQAISESDLVALAGPWRGTWTADGFEYEALMTLQVKRDGSVEGFITWTLRASPRQQEASKIGMTAIEYVRGRYHPNTGFLAFDGYSKDDPNTIIGLAKYRLVVSDTRKTMGGLSFGSGPWEGSFFLKR